MNTVHVPPTKPEVIKPPATNPIVDGNPGDNLQLPADKPMGEMPGGEADAAGDDDDESEKDESEKTAKPADASDDDVEDKSAQ